METKSPEAGMTKEQVERLVEDKMGFRFEMNHVGNHRWESGNIPTSFESCGVFTGMFSGISVKVNTTPCDQVAFPGWFSFTIHLDWRYIEGGTNGAARALFYYAPDDALLTRKEADTKYWSVKK